jgi:hypothetical protein
MNVKRLCVAVALLSDLIRIIETLDQCAIPAAGAGRPFAFHDLPEAYRDAFAACLADESKLLRIHGAPCAHRLREELFLWIDELAHSMAVG